MKSKESINQKVQEKPLLPREKLQLNEETRAKMKRLGLKEPNMIRGMMDELSEINICFLE